MADSAWHQLDQDDEAAPVLKRRPLRESGEMDITPMIDITFLLLIFFIVASIPDAQTAVELPKARHGASVDPSTCVIITVAESGTADQSAVYLANGKMGEPLSGSRNAQDEQIISVLEQGKAEGKQNVLVKAERGLRHHHVARVTQLVGEVGQMQLFVAVLESD